MLRGGSAVAGSTGERDDASSTRETNEGDAGCLVVGAARPESGGMHACMHAEAPHGGGTEVAVGVGADQAAADRHPGLLPWAASFHSTLSLSGHGGTALSPRKL